MTAVVIGATGLTGSFLVRQLLLDPAITQVISVSRRPLNLPNLKLTEVLIADLGELPSVAAKLIGNLYFCCLGSTIKAAGSKESFEKVDRTAVTVFAEIAKAANARTFTLISAMGANPKSAFFYNQVKGSMESDVIALRLHTLIIFRPAFLAGPRGESRPVERAITKVFVPLLRVLPTGARKRLITEAETLAGRMIVEAKAPGEAIRIIPAKEI